ncbi:hypothetical protein D3C87_1042700 [compost metagenome]
MTQSFFAIGQLLAQLLIDGFRFSDPRFQSCLGIARLGVCGNQFTVLHIRQTQGHLQPVEFGGPLVCQGLRGASAVDRVVFRRAQEGRVDLLQERRPIRIGLKIRKPKNRVAKVRVQKLGLVQPQVLLVDLRAQEMGDPIHLTVRILHQTVVVDDEHTFMLGVGQARDNVVYPKQVALLGIEGIALGERFFDAQGVSDG